MGITVTHRKEGRASLRVAIGLLFVAAGVSKLVAPVATASILAARGIPAAELVGTLVAFAEIAGGALLVAAWRPRLIVASLAVFVLLAAGLLHFPIVLAGPRALELALDAGVFVALYSILRASLQHRDGV